MRGTSYIYIQVLQKKCKIIKRIPETAKSDTVIGVRIDFVDTFLFLYPEIDGK